MKVYGWKFLLTTNVAFRVCITAPELPTYNSVTLWFKPGGRFGNNKNIFTACHYSEDTKHYFLDRPIYTESRKIMFRKTRYVHPLSYIRFHGKKRFSADSEFLLQAVQQCIKQRKIQITTLPWRLTDRSCVYRGSMLHAWPRWHLHLIFSLSFSHSFSLKHLLTMLWNVQIIFISPFYCLYKIVGESYCWTCAPTSLVVFQGHKGCLNYYKM